MAVSCTPCHTTNHRCSVQPLTWGRFSSRTLSLAAQPGRPVIILGADILYSGEHAADVLATVALLLGGSGGSGDGNGGDSGGGGGGGGNSGGSGGVGFGVGGDGGDGGGSDETAAAQFHNDAVTSSSQCALPEGKTASRKRAASDADECSSATVAPEPRQCQMPNAHASPQSQLWMTYHERSSGRTLLPALSAAWGLQARSVPLSSFAPESILDDARCDSVRMLIFTLLAAFCAHCRCECVFTCAASRCVLSVCKHPVHWLDTRVIASPSAMCAGVQCAHRTIHHFTLLAAKRSHHVGLERVHACNCAAAASKGPGSCKPKWMAMHGALKVPGTFTAELDITLVHIHLLHARSVLTTPERDMRPHGQESWSQESSMVVTYTNSMSSRLHVCHHIASDSVKRQVLELGGHETRCVKRLVARTGGPIVLRSSRLRSKQDACDHG